jgi:pimeloyl-ACP methyl ester carboxylesterase
MYTMQLHVEDLTALLDRLQLGPAHIVGSSYGAVVGLSLALERPDLVRSLVLGEASAVSLLQRTPAGDSLRRAFVASTLDPTRAAFQRGDSVEGLRRFVGGILGAPDAFDRMPPEARAYFLRHSFEMRRELAADPRQLSPDFTCQQLNRIATPVLLLQGQRSPRMFHLINDELARCMHTETVMMIPGAGHRMHADQPASYNQAVLRFLAAH